MCANSKRKTRFLLCAFALTMLVSLTHGLQNRLMPSEFLFYSTSQFNLAKSCCKPQCYVALRHPNGESNPQPSSITAIEHPHDNLQWGIQGKPPHVGCYLLQPQCYVTLRNPNGESNPQPSA